MRTRPKERVFLVSPASPASPSSAGPHQPCSPESSPVSKRSPSSRLTRLTRHNHALVPRPTDDRRHARTHELLPPRRVCARARPVTLSCAVLCLVHVEGIPVVPQVCAADATVPAPARTSCAQSVSESESESESKTETESEYPSWYLLAMMDQKGSKGEEGQEGQEGRRWARRAKMGEVGEESEESEESEEVRPRCKGYVRQVRVQVVQREIGIWTSYKRHRRRTRLPGLGVGVSHPRSSVVSLLSASSPC